ncbi:MAG: alpha/beta-type small acid-soluble spore protein [Limnochordaceae bacterium]|nr:alpha/beta-type small acid-soluble spore protein [Limnochordaceae bacterium]
MKQLKWEVADQLGLADDLQDPDELSVREAGKVGGNMVRRLIERGKQAMAKEQGEDNLPPPHR